MFNQDAVQKSAVQWLFNFFTAVKIDNNKIEYTHPEQGYNMQEELAVLKLLLQDAGISRIPPGCKLPHQHYRNPLIHDHLDSRQYIVYEKATVQDNYVEFYLRDEGTGYIVGYEAVKINSEYGGVTGQRISHERSLFEVDMDSRLSLSAFKYLNDNGLGESIVQSRSFYEKYKTATEKFINELLSK